MLRDKYDQDKFFLKIEHLVGEMDPELAAIDEVLDDEVLFQHVKGALAQRRPQTLVMGRPSTPVEVILRMLVIKHLYNLSYEQTERQVKDSLVLRRFCRVYFEEVPDDTTLIRWAGLIEAETLEALNEQVLTLACRRKLTKGRKLRTDGTVVESNIHYPTDNSLLYDGVRVLSRLLKRAQQVLGDSSDLARAVFRDRTRSAKRAARQIVREAIKGAKGVEATYRRLVSTAQACVQQAKQVLEVLQQETSQASHRLCHSLETVLPQVQQIITQTVRRVFQGQKLPPQQKLVSLFEPHTAIIQRGKAGRETEFGHKVWLDEVEGGFISHHRILAGNPPEDEQWQPSLENHIRLFGHPPRLASADRGLFSSGNEIFAQQLGVKRVVLPQRGAKDAVRRRYERQAWFRRGRRWHAGIEGRISVIKRKHGLERCLNHGEQGFARWLGWGVLTHNLGQIGRTLVRL